MSNRFDPVEHAYYMDEVQVPSLTQMLQADGWSRHLDSAPRDVVRAKGEWGSSLHVMLQASEYAFCAAMTDFEPHIRDWKTLCRRMGWGPHPVWKNAELPVYVNQDGMKWAFTPDRAAPEAVVEIKGTYAPHPSHHLQTSLQVLGMGYPESTPRYIAYFDKSGLKRLVPCERTINHNGSTLDVFDESRRILFDHALPA
jgi:hypothetical protein